MTGPVTERPMGWTGRQTPQGDAPSDRSEKEFDLRGASRAVRRQLPLVAICAGLGAAVAILMILGSIPRFQAVETVLLDEERSELLEEVSPIPNALYTNSAIQSELEIVKSKALARRVAERMNLHEDEAFMNPPVSTTEWAMGLVGRVTEPVADFLEPEPEPAPETGGGGAGPRPEEETDPDAAAIEAAAVILRRNLSVSRVGRSFVLNISYEGYSPERARDIARAYGQSYKTYQLESSREVAANAGQWIQQRLETLEERSLDAAAEVQRFRAENDLVQVRGDLLSEQQLSEMASELIEASADTAQIGARLENLQSLQDAAPAEAFGLATLRGADGEERMLSDLRADYLETRRRYLSMVEEYSADHIQAQQLETTLDSLETVIAEEVDRAVRTVQAEYEIAQSREQSLRDDLNSITDGRTDDIATLGRLNQLEAVAQTYQAVYRDYLQRYELTTQQEAFPIASVQIISEAELPRGASSPQKKAMLASGIFLGLLFGATVAAVRELGPRRLRTRGDVEAWLGLPCAGLLPKRVPGAGRRGRAARTAWQTRARVLQAIESAAGARRPTIVGFAPVMRGVDPLRTAGALAESAAAQRGLDVRIVDTREDPAPGDLRRLRNSGVRAEDRSGLEAAIDAKADDAADLVILVMPALTDMGGIDPLSQLCHATVLGLPWGRVRPEMVAGALSDHEEFRARLVTTVVDGAKLKAARMYMARGNYEEQATHA